MARLAVFFDHFLWDFRSFPWRRNQVARLYHRFSYCPSACPLTAYPFTYPCPSSAAAALLAQLHSPGFQGLAAVQSFSFPCGQVCLPIPAAVAASWPWFHPFSYPSLQIIHGVLFIFQISPTSIFLCKVSASGVPQGPPSGTCLVIFFKFLGCGCSWSKNSMVGDEKNNGHPLPLHTFLLPAPSCT